MSARVSGVVWGDSRNGQRVGGSRHGGSTLLVLLALADSAHDDGGSIYPSVATLAAKTRLSERQIQRTIAVLERSGEIFVHRGAGPGGVNQYTVNLELLREGGDKMTPPVTDAPDRGDTHVTTGVTGTSPNPLSEPSLNLRSDPPDSSFRKAKKRTIPDDFVLTPERRARIIASGHREGCGDLDPEAFFTHFVETNRDEGYTHSNWERTLVNWCKGERPNSPYRINRSETPGSWGIDLRAQLRPQKVLKDEKFKSMGNKTEAELEEERRRLLASRKPGESLFDMAAAAR